MENAKSVRPLAGIVVLEPVEQKETIEGLALPDSQKKESLRGKVVAISESFINEQGIQFLCPVKVDDIVVYRQYSEQEIEVNFKKYILAKFSDLSAIVE